VSVGTTYHMRYDLRPVNLNLPAKSHDYEYQIYPGHQAAITQVGTDGEHVVTGAKNGEVRVLNFNVYKNQLNMGPSCFTIQNGSTYNTSYPQ
jgi:hypothetical protein